MELDIASDVGDELSLVRGEGGSTGVSPSSVSRTSSRRDAHSRRASRRQVRMFFDHVI